MTTKTENGAAAKMSKYAQKRAKLAASEALENAANVTDERNDTLAVGDNTSDTLAPQAERFTRKPFKKPYNREKNADGLPAVVDNFPKHVVGIALLIKNNAEIRRFTALGVLNYLLQKGEITGDHRYVTFKWNKFAVKANNLMREYSYNEPFFLNALVAAFSSFSASAQRIIDEFCRQEMSIGLNKAVDQDEVNDIVALNEQYQNKEAVTD